MEIVVHNSQLIKSKSDLFDQFTVPVWEVEIKSDTLNSNEFCQSLAVEDNFTTSPDHGSNLRSVFVGQGLVAQFLEQSYKDQLVDIAFEDNITKARFPMGKDRYKSRGVWLSSILRDSAGFSMRPHIDNSHVMIHMIVNLVQDNTTATDFFNVDSEVPVYRAPTKRNHGVIFVNTPGAIHAINGINDTRWIWYASVLI